MLHQPFEAWILDPKGLSPQDRQALRAHLESCAHCRQLTGKWHATEHQLTQQVMVGPAPGFVQRWQMRLAASRARNLFTLRRITPVLIIAMIVVAFALIVQVFSSRSFIDLLNEFSRGLIWISAQIQGILQAVSDWLSNPLGHLPLAVVVFAALVITLVWLTVLWRILRKGESADDK